MRQNPVPTELDNILSCMAKKVSVTKIKIGSANMKAKNSPAKVNMGRKNNDITVT